MSERADQSVPHMRGDEPDIMEGVNAKFRPFPTCVGMNRGTTIHPLALSAVPHMRGDEPLEWAWVGKLCSRSPHAWG